MPDLSSQKKRSSFHSVILFKFIYTNITRNMYVENKILFTRTSTSYRTQTKQKRNHANAKKEKRVKKEPGLSF